MEALNYLESLKPSVMTLGLERLESALKILPFKLPSNNIIVAGTNGKGSTCAFLSNILSKSGLKVGFFSSPHLIEVNERIKINNKPIDSKSLENYTNLLKNLLEKHNINLTYFEFLTILAMWYFVENETDINILEVGLGGRLDATNIFPSMLSIITSISHDHTKVLGKTLKDIAKEKAGIIKKEIPTLISNQKPSVLNVIFEECRKKSSKPIELSKNIKIKDIKLNQNGLSFSCMTKRNKYNIFTSHLGIYQIENSSLAILASEMISELLKFPLTPEAVEIGIGSTEWIGRFKKYQLNGRQIYLDGAHNLGGIKKLIKSIKKLKIDKLEIGFSALKDKNPEKLLKEVISISSKIYLFCLQTERGMKYNDWEKLCKKNNVKNYEIMKVEDIKNIIKEKNVQLFTGSLFFIGEVLKCLKK